MRSWTKNHYLLSTVRVVFDVAFLTGAYVVAAMLTAPSLESVGEFAYTFAFCLVVFACVWVGVAIDQGLYLSARSESIVKLMFSVTKTYVAAVLGATFIIALIWTGGFHRMLYGVFFVLGLAALLLFRTSLGLSLWNLRRRGYNARRIVIVGANARTAHLVDTFRSNEQYGFVIEGFLEDDEARREGLERMGLTWLGPIASLENLLTEQVVDSVYISLPVRSHYETILKIAHLCEGVGVPVRFLADLFPLRMANSSLMRLGRLPLLSLTFEPESNARFALNRIIDVAVATSLIVLLSPVFLIVALLIKVTSGGSVFARRERLSHNFEPFQLLSFRVSENGGAPEKLTAFGRFIRRFGIEDMPQLFNVLMGHVMLTVPLPSYHETGLANDEAHTSHGKARSGTADYA